MRLPALLVLIALGIAVALSFVASARLFVYRHDQKWRRERGAWFGEWPLSHGWENIYRREFYTPDGHRLIPVAMALQALTIVLAIAAFAMLIGAV